MKKLNEIKKQVVLSKADMKKLKGKGNVDLQNMLQKQQKKG
ncbi:MAG: hypothetical protein AAFX87_00390 [Bacteroidota bacterium]